MYIPFISPNASKSSFVRFSKLLTVYRRINVAPILTGSSPLGVCEPEGVASMVNVFNPDVVSFSGGVAHYGKMLFEPVRAEVKRRAFRSMTRRLRIVRSRLGDACGVIGAARALMLEQEASPRKSRS